MTPAGATASSFDWSEGTQAIAAVATLIVAIAAWRIASRAQATDRSGFVAEMRKYWEALSVDWATVLLFRNGADFYYSAATPEERKRVQDLISRVNGGLNITEWSAVITAESPTVRRVTRFFAYAGDALMRGEWSLNEAYSLFGPDVARHYETLLWLSHRRPVRPPGPKNPELTEWEDSVDELVEFNFYDEQEVLFLLAFLLRAEQCRRGDTYPHFIVDLAKEVRARSKNLDALLARVSRTRGRKFPLRRLRFALRRAAHPTIESAYLLDTVPLIHFDDQYLFRPAFRSLKWTRWKIGRLSRGARIQI
jgi:hypothetical protein